MTRTDQVASGEGSPCFAYGSFCSQKHWLELIFMCVMDICMQSIAFLVFFFIWTLVRHISNASGIACGDLIVTKHGMFWRCSSCALSDSLG